MVAAPTARVYVGPPAGKARPCVEPFEVAALPDRLTRKHNVDSTERFELTSRRVFFGLIGLLLVVALGNAFGQHPEVTVAASPRAELEVNAPTALRGGIYFQGRFTVRAREELREATLVLDSGWMESIHINTIEPSPVGEASRDGDLALELGHVPAGDKHVLYLQFQVNPTNVGRRSQTVRLYDGDELVATSTRTVTVFP